MKRVGPLTSRQRQIVRMLAMGRTRKEIASEMGRANNTVDQIKANAMLRLGARTPAHLVAIVYGVTP